MESFTVNMMENQAIVALPITIIPDTIPEFDETFTVELLGDRIYGGATLGVVFKCEVVVLENDYPYGLIGKMG